MQASFMSGIVCCILGGVLCGSWALPIKRLRAYGLEHWLLVTALMGLTVVPWGVLLLCFHEPLALLRGVPAACLVKANLCFMAWGIANVMFARCLARIGLSLTYAIMTGVGIPIGILVPMFIKGSGAFADAPALASGAGVIILGGTVLMVLAVALSGYAGCQREQLGTTSHARVNGGGILMAVLIGVLQIGMTFAFVYSQGPILAAFAGGPAQPLDASLVVWAVSLPGGVVIIVGCALVFMCRNRSWGALSQGGDFLRAAISGTVLFAGFILLGVGMRHLGKLGPSLGFGAVNASQIIVSQVIGVATGEWRSAPPRLVRLMTAAILLIVAAIGVMAVAQYRGS